jgi:hypothetical protein
MAIVEEEKRKLKGSAAHRLVYLERINTQLRTFLLDVVRAAPANKGIVLRENNMNAFAYFQGSLDIAQDLLDIMNGKSIQTPSEIAKEIEKKEKERTRDGYL